MLSTHYGMNTSEGDEAYICETVYLLILPRYTAPGPVHELGIVVRFVFAKIHSW